MSESNPQTEPAPATAPATAPVEATVQTQEAPPQPPPKPLPPRSRRGFFGELMHNIAAPLVDVVDERFNLGLKDIRDNVRPPGAIPESKFLETCRHSGYCVEACPVKAIVPLPLQKRRDGGTPVVIADTQPCVMCYDLACMAVCPTGAILPRGREEIKMGIAKWKPTECLRNKDDDCRICVDKCPFQERAIRLTSKGEVYVMEEGCTGCGVCTFYCPTKPKAIVVDPM